MARKKQDTEEKRAVIREWDRWVTDHVPAYRKATGDDGMAFFNYLNREHPSLLDFKTKISDKRQAIHGWLIREGKVIDESWARALLGFLFRAKLQP